MTTWDPYRDPPLPMKPFFQMYKLQVGLVRRLEERLEALVREIEAAGGRRFPSLPTWPTRLPRRLRSPCTRPPWR